MAEASSALTTASSSLPSLGNPTLETAHFSAVGLAVTTASNRPHSMILQSFRRQLKASIFLIYHRLNHILATSFNSLPGKNSGILKALSRPLWILTILELAAA
jgi:hypothetical protein